jgi:radical SAM protein with 4Fe4S-binding SPASM domain
MLREKPACCSGIDRLIIGPDLRIFPCDAFKHIDPKDLGVSSDFSNLEYNSLASCWENSAFLGVVRKYLTTEFAKECKDCSKLESCLSGCMAQKYYATGILAKCADPMCLKQNEFGDRNGFK